jgi:hypothetical protein
MDGSQIDALKQGLTWLTFIGAGVSIASMVLKLVIDIAEKTAGREEPNE